MTEIHCKSCGSVTFVKNGFVRGQQRYRCRACGCNFTNTPLRGKPAAMKALAILLYAMGNMSFLGIARILGVSDVAVMKWVRAEAQSLPDFLRPTEREKREPDRPARSFTNTGFVTIKRGQKCRNVFCVDGPEMLCLMGF